MGITPQQFKEIQARLATGRRAAEPLMPATSGVSKQRQSVILGIDPSLRGTGYGLIRLGRPFPETLAFGTIICKANWPHSRCLVHIVQSLRQLLQQHRPSLCVVEGLFYA